MPREVCIIVSNVKTGDYYKAKSYPDPDIDNDGRRELYETPVYYVYIDGKDEHDGAVRNTYSPYNGAIQIKDSFLIHAGPTSLSNTGWGSAGCVEIIGDFNQFKKDIHLLSGITAINEDDAIVELVGKRKLFVQVDLAYPPNFRGNVVGYY